MFDNFDFQFHRSFIVSRKHLTKYTSINLVPCYLAQNNEDDESADEEIMEIEQAEYMNGWVRIDECQCCRDVKRNLTV